MWVFTKYGMYSVVADRQPGMLKVRARTVKHLNNLLERFSVLQGYRIRTSHTTDYYARLIVPRDVWMEVHVNLLRDVVYDNFKSEVHRTGHCEVAYENALSRTWGTMLGVQLDSHPRPARRRSGDSLFKDELQ